MDERYEPPSEFLQMVIEELIPLSGNAYADSNRRRLIALTTDADRANRDWATMLLAQTEVDDEAVRTALLLAANDEYDAVRAEAIHGLAQRDRDLTLPLLQQALKQEQVMMPIFEAASLVAHPSLVADLERFAEPGEHPWLDKYVFEALAACRAAAD